MNADNQIIGANVKMLRKKQKITQIAFGKILEIEQSAVSRVESGSQQLTVLQLRIAKRALKCRFEDLYRGIP